MRFAYPVTTTLSQVHIQITMHTIHYLFTLPSDMSAQEARNYVPPAKNMETEATRKEDDDGDDDDGVDDDDDDDDVMAMVVW